jgi:SAM-dependent methyltransferase
LDAYGKEFAKIYNEKWDLWARGMWPFILKSVTSHRNDARTWLDLCCGTGGLLKLACDGGFDAVGVDLSPHQLTYARQKAPRARVVKRDVRALSLKRKFDVITCIFDSLNYLLTMQDLESALRVARSHLDEGGLFIFDVKTPEGFRGERNKIFRDRRYMVVFESHFDERQLLHSFFVTGFVRQGSLYKRFEEEHAQRAFEAREIERTLSLTALDFKKYDGETFSVARKRSKRLVYVCTEKRSPPPAPGGATGRCQ